MSLCWNASWSIFYLKNWEGEIGCYILKVVWLPLEQRGMITSCNLLSVFLLTDHYWLMFSSACRGSQLLSSSCSPCIQVLACVTAWSSSVQGAELCMPLLSFIRLVNLFPVAWVGPSEVAAKPWVFCLVLYFPFSLNHLRTDRITAFHKLLKRTGSRSLWNLSRPLINCHGTWRTAICSWNWITRTC